MSLRKAPPGERSSYVHLSGLHTDQSHDVVPEDKQSIESSMIILCLNKDNKPLMMKKHFYFNTLVFTPEDQTQIHTAQECMPPPGRKATLTLVETHLPTYQLPTILTDDLVDSEI